jgi:hypothetical protein
MTDDHVLIMVLMEIVDGYCGLVMMKAEHRVNSKSPTSLPVHRRSKKSLLY